MTVAYCLLPIACLRKLVQKSKRIPIVPAKIGTNSAQEILRGVAQAQNQFNQQNGLQGRLVEIVIADDDNNRNIAKQIAQQLVQDTSILGVIGHSSSAVTYTALPIYTRVKLAIISPTNTSIALESAVFFRALPSDKATAEKLAKYALKNSFKKIVIFCNPDESYSRSIKEEFRLTFVKNQREGVVPYSCINLDDPNLDVEQEVRKLMDDPLVEAIALFPDTENIEVAMKIAKTYNDNLRTSNNVKQIKVLGSDTLYKSEVANTLEGLVLAIPWFREAPQAKIFGQKAIEQWGGAVSWRTATSYDATQAFIQALSPNSDRTTVIDKLRNPGFVVNNTSTYGDPLQFSPEGERQTEPILVQIQGGKWVMLQTK
ncbi:amino acid ABC transporter substrate-binding protein [Nostoc edaphicum CCNP1411]|uniref:Amino acid ABC transporter substrate-binding protein n=1 Tax=Nostoc edaphicum CCNP1411 TaxID=1472755 RepID=A0A7D7LEA3_9NOSO|nr:ABC transporter substrate-binding protein [Nostoc edaphicum]QMS91253.1 amino acid ABC transporter substrate-binding protein [Nostoc edaphicum CCNP1411]